MPPPPGACSFGRPGRTVDDPPAASAGQAPIADRARRYNRAGTCTARTEAMDWPYHFPHPADVIAREADRARHLSVGDRLAQLADLIAAGELLARSAESREVNRRLRQQAEAEWQQAQRALFARHGY